MTEYAFYVWDENEHCGTFTGELENDKAAIAFMIGGNDAHVEIWREVDDGIKYRRHLVASW